MPKRDMRLEINKEEPQWVQEDLFDIMDGNAVKEEVSAAEASEILEGWTKAYGEAEEKLEIETQHIISDLASKMDLA